MGAISRLLSTCDPTRLMAKPRGDQVEVEQVWQEFWEAIETVRWYTERPETWTANFTTGFLAMLLPRERLALPGETERLIWTGGDSTLDRMGCADWSAKMYGVMQVDQVAGPLQAFLGDEATGELMIALGELFCLIILAVTRASAWDGMLVLYVTDNENANSWLKKRRARNRLARYGLRLLQRLETKHHFQVIAGAKDS